MSRAEDTVVIQRHRPITNNRLILYWSPVFVEDGIEVFGSGTKPSTETVEVKRILRPVQLHELHVMLAGGKEVVRATVVGESLEIEWLSLEVHFQDTEY